MEKKVDENWKEQVEREKVSAQRPEPAVAPAAGLPSQEQEPRAQRPRSARAPQGEFSMFLSTLSMQALIALGEMPHPMTQSAQEDLEQARYLIDVLGMLQEKTKGNLSPEESALLDGILYELRMKYVAKSTGAPP